MCVVLQEKSVPSRYEIESLRFFMINLTLLSRIFFSCSCISHDLTVYIFLCDIANWMQWDLWIWIVAFVKDMKSYKRWMALDSMYQLVFPDCKWHHRGIYCRKRMIASWRNGMKRQVCILLHGRLDPNTFLVSSFAKSKLAVLPKWMWGFN